MLVRSMCCRLLATGVVVLPLLNGAAQAQAPTIKVYLSAPNMVGAQAFSGVTTTIETFSGTAGKYTSNYSSSIGTYTLSTTNAFNIVADDQYGSGTGNYMSFGSQSATSGPITLTFAKAQSYFGFSWNAGDANNGISFYNGNTLIGRYSTADTVNLLKNSTVTSLNGTVYQSSLYKGKPTGTSTAPSTNTAEPYGFLNFFAADASSTFTKVVFDNSSTTSTGFETDNHMIVASGTPTAQGSFVSVGTATTPEPGTFALALPALVGGIVYCRRVRRKNAATLASSE